MFHYFNAFVLNAFTKIGTKNEDRISGNKRIMRSLSQIQIRRLVFEIELYEIRISKLIREVFICLKNVNFGPGLETWNNKYPKSKLSSII